MTLKRLLIAAAAALAVACNPAKEAPELKGAYKMLSQNFKFEKRDTTRSVPELKIFSDGYVMYATLAPDSSASFGFGTYTVADGTVTETIQYRANDTTIVTEPSSFTLDIEKTDQGYKQVIKDMQSDEGKMTLTEEYQNVSSPQTSPLDGAWEAVSIISINGKDTVKEDGVQYKMFWAGNFIFGHTTLDSLKRPATGMGFGRFEMSGDNKSKETIDASNYSTLIGNTYEIDIEMHGTDEYQQTISVNGTRLIELYRRRK